MNSDLARRQGENDISNRSSNQSDIRCDSTPKNYKGLKIIRITLIFLFIYVMIFLPSLYFIDGSFIINILFLLPFFIGLIIIMIVFLWQLYLKRISEE